MSAIQRVDLVRFEDRLHGNSEASRLANHSRRAWISAGFNGAAMTSSLLSFVRHLPRRGGGVKIGRGALPFTGGNLIQEGVQQ